MGCIDSSVHEGPTWFPSAIDSQTWPIIRGVCKKNADPWALSPRDSYSVGPGEAWTP